MKTQKSMQFMFILLIVTHYNPCLIRRRLMSGPNGLDKPLVLTQSGLLDVRYLFFLRAMEGEQGGYPKSEQLYRSRGGGCFTKGRSRGRKQAQVSWKAKTQSTDDGEPHAMQHVSDAESSNTHSVPVSDAETSASNPYSIPGDSLVGSDSDMEERIKRKRSIAQPKLAFHGDGRSRGESSVYNGEPEVGNIGFSSAIGGKGPV